MPTLIRITTIPLALDKLLNGQMAFMKNNGFNVIMMSANGVEREKVVNNERCEHIIIPMTRKITPIKDLYCLFLLTKQFKKIKPDIVHSHTPKAGLLGMLAAWIVRVPIRMHTVAGLPLMVETGFKKRLLIYIEKLTYSAATLVLPNSESLKKYIIENKFCSPNKIDLIGLGSSNGIDIGEFERKTLKTKDLEEIKKNIEYNPENKYILSVGRIVKDKGIAELVDAFEKLSRKGNKIKLLLVGPVEDDLDPLPFETKQKILINPNIISVGFSNKVGCFMAISDILVHASYREGFPNVLLQAGVVGCPIICSDIPGNIDIVTNKETGLIFKAKNVEDLVSKIEFALENKEILKTYAENLSHLVANNFSRPFVQNEIMNKYNSLLGKSLNNILLNA